MFSAQIGNVLLKAGVRSGKYTKTCKKRYGERQSLIIQMGIQKNEMYVSVSNNVYII